jgi:ABC-type bacteriocin/lantibiotic exporter with double-glycine peptidase domain
MPPPVPHFYQSSEATCGPACVRMLAAALGVTVDEPSVARHCHATTFGCAVDDLVDGAQRLGLAAQMLPIYGENDAIQCLSNRVPFIAMIDLSGLPGGAMLQWHFVVVLASSSAEVIFHDPADGPDQRAALEDFLAAWQRGGYRGVSVWTP